MPAKKKPTMKEMETVTNNIIHDLQIINQKADATFWGMKNLVEFLGKTKEFDDWLLKIKEKAEKEHNERLESDKASNETDSGKSDK